MKENRRLRKTKGSNKTILFEILEFVLEKKRWWLIPTIVFLILVAILIIFVKINSASPFIYAIF